MKLGKMRTAPALLCGAVLCVLAGPLAATATAQSNDMILIRASAKTPDATVEAIKTHVEQKKWLNMGVNKANQGRVTLVKICMPEIGRQIFEADLRLSALLPCGNVGVYAKDGKTEVSVLDPRYMAALDPHPVLKKVAPEARALLDQMLDEVTK